MISNNIILIFFILIVIGVIVYFYHNYKNMRYIQNEDNTVTLMENNKKKNNKRVRFNDNVKYNTYRNNSSISSTNNFLGNSDNSFNCATKNKSKINVDDILTSIIPNNCSLDLCNSINTNTNSENSIISDQLPIKKITNIFPSNFDHTDPEAMWDASFGLSLVNKDEKQIFTDKIKKNHKEYDESLGQFIQYQMDNSSLIKTDITIDPFKPEHKSNRLKGQTIKEIYDQQVAGPKAKPKRIKAKTSNNIIYEDESELNGGTLNGTNLCAFDNTNDIYKMAEFGNEF